jgi:mannose-1-phosphate guanylyltransferase
MFIYKLKFFREFLRQYNSYYADQYNKLDKTWGHAQKFSGIFKQIIPESIDFALMEKVMEMRMFPARFAWNDVGSWSSVFELNKKDRDGNVKVGRHAAFDTNHSLLFSTEGLPIAAIGLDQMVVVHTKNGILVAPMDELERVRDAITKLK